MKVRKTARPFRYDLNQVPYDYTVEGRNRFKGLDLIGRVPDELWNEVRDTVRETEIKTILYRKIESYKNRKNLYIKVAYLLYKELGLRFWYGGRRCNITNIK